MENLRIQSEHYDGWVVARIQGDLDVYTAPRLREFISDSVSLGDANLVLDLEGVGFLDSTGLSVMVAGLKKTKEAGGDLLIIKPNPQIQRILSITDLVKILPIHADIEEALADH